MLPPTPKQRYLLSRLIRGIHPRIIAQEMGCTYGTIRNHIAQLARRCGTPTKGDARKAAFVTLWKQINARPVTAEDPTFL